MAGLLHDVRFMLRHAARTPGPAALIVVSLAVGIGANTAIFSVYRAMLLKPLPVDDPQSLVLFYWGADRTPAGMMQSSDSRPRDQRWPSSSRSFSYPFFQKLATRTDAFEAVFAFAPLGMGRYNTTLASAGSAERVDAEMVSGSYFSGLGVVPNLGRVISPGDERDGARVAVLSYAFWSRRFESDRNAIGQAVTLNNEPFEIVGVAPRGFFGVQPGRAPDVWIPMMDVVSLTPWGFRPERTPSLLRSHDYWWVRVMARVRDGVEQQAERALDGELQTYVAQVLPGNHPEHLPRVGLESAAAGLDVVRETYEQPLRLLLAVVGVVLLIACANVALLLLSQGVARRRELAMRLSLGATRARLVRQFMTEHLAIALAGAALGVLCAAWTARGLLLLVPEGRRPLLDAPIDVGVLMFSLLVAVGAALLFGVVPALVATRVDVQPALKSSSASAGLESAAHRLWSSIFIVAQVALAVVLIVGAALFLRTLMNLRGQPLGVDEAKLLVFGVDASQNGYSGERLVDVYKRLLQTVQAVPGVEAASVARHRLFSGTIGLSPVSAAGARPGAAGTGTQVNIVGPDFATALGLQPLAGRDLAWRDFAGNRRVALVNEALAVHLFGEVSAVGRRFTLGKQIDPESEYEIVGVLSNAKYSRVRGEFPRVAYLSFTTAGGVLRGLYFQVRAAGDPLSLSGAMREAARRVDPRLALFEMDAMPNQIEDSLWQERMFARLTTAFGATALLLACVGIYGTISYAVGRRRNEIALRMALGAARVQVLAMVLRKALWLAAAGVAAGIPLALWTGRFTASLLFGLTPSDPSTLAAAIVVMVAVALLAAYLPARRATLIDPATALKQE